MVIWLRFQITPTYTVVKTVRLPVRKDSESAPHGLLKNQLASGIRGLDQFFRHWRNLVWPKDFLPGLDEISGPQGTNRAN